MKILVTRVNKARVSSSEGLESAINRGLVLFVGIEKTDKEKDLVYMSNKVVNLRVFENQDSKL
ncbi:MAG: D-aminoacyl-tRNA deacylase, partial [Candidatus Omnitrophica bacterium]|nr:D-aminoacyl-tRNA deacylase [Candidatus Omnitrophota bacterium]